MTSCRKTRCNFDAICFTLYIFEERSPRNTGGETWLTRPNPPDSSYPLLTRRVALPLRTTQAEMYQPTPFSYVQRRFGQLTWTIAVDMKVTNLSSTKMHINRQHFSTWHGDYFSAAVAIQDTSVLETRILNQFFWDATVLSLYFILMLCAWLWLAKKLCARETVLQNTMRRSIFSHSTMSSILPIGRFLLQPRHVGKKRSAAAAIDT